MEVIGVVVGVGVEVIGVADPFVRGAMVGVVVRRPGDEVLGVRGGVDGDKGNGICVGACVLVLS